MQRPLAIWVLDGDKFKIRNDYRTRKGGCGWGLSNQNVSYTITAVDRHMVAYIREKDGNAKVICESR